MTDSTKSTDELLMEMANQPIEVSETLKTKARRAIDSFVALTRERPDQIFISNSRSDPKYPALWLFSKEVVMKAENFIAEDNYDILPFSTFHHAQLFSSSFEPGSAGPESDVTLSMSGREAYSLGAELESSGVNCQYLYDLARDLIPRVLAKNLRR